MLKPSDGNHSWSLKTVEKWCKLWNRILFHGSFPFLTASFVKRKVLSVFGEMWFQNVIRTWISESMICWIIFISVASKFVGEIYVFLCYHILWSEEFGIQKYRVRKHRNWSKELLTHESRFTIKYGTWRVSSKERLEINPLSYRNDHYTKQVDW